jgi:hypothetical protein
MASVDNVYDIAPINKYVASSGQTVFDYDFPIFDAVDLRVYVGDVLQSIGTDYTVQGEGNENGGTVTFTSGRSSGQQITIYRLMPIERLTDMAQNGPMRAADFNQELDRITMYLQEVRRDMDRSLRFGILGNSPSPELSPIDNWKDRYLYVNSSGALEPSVNVGTTPLSQSIIGDLLYPQTSIELSNSIDPAFKQYPPGHLFRYVNPIDAPSTGNGSHDDTAAWAACLLACSGAPYQMHVPKPPVSYRVGPLHIPSDIGIVIDAGTIVEATPGFSDDGGGPGTDRLLDFNGSSNVVMLCNGAQFRMLKSEYTTGEHRHCFNLVNCTNVIIDEPVAYGSGGDGYYINGVTDVTINNPVADNNRRQGMSVISATRLRVTGVARLMNTSGTDPQFGLDFEPNGPSEGFQDVAFDIVEVSGNAGGGVAFYADKYSTGTPPDMSVSIGRIVSRGNGGNALRARRIYSNVGAFSGHIDIGEVVSFGDALSAVHIADKWVSGPLLSIGRILAENPCVSGATVADRSAVFIQDTSLTAVGGVRIGDIVARSNHTDMDYGLTIEIGGGITQSAFNVSSIVGAQTAPVRISNSTQASSDASTVDIDQSKLRTTLPLSASTNITAAAHLGRVITNAGASGIASFVLQNPIPSGVAYRFRVEAAQTLQIRPADSNAIISGTTTPGANVTSNVVGAEAEVRYLGVLNSVPTWQLTPVGNPGDWTWT